MLFFFFFFKQKTAYEMRISDWSSDVCSSDLTKKSKLARDFVGITTMVKIVSQIKEPVNVEMELFEQKFYDSMTSKVALLNRITYYKIGRASCRERVCQYV